MTHKVVFILVLCLMALGLTASGMTAAVPLGSGFTYQGELQDGEGPVNGSCDFKFSLWDKALNGSRLGQEQSLVDVAVADGRFTVLLNNAGQFGPDAFDGQARWLEISVRCPAKSGVYAKLQPRQQLTAAPYATYSQNGGDGNDHNHLSQTWETNNNHTPLRIEGPIPYFSAPLSLSNSSPDGYGLLIDSSGNDGMHVSSAGADGVYVESAGDDGVYVELAGDDGVVVQWVKGDGVAVYTAGHHGVKVENARRDGVHVWIAADDGVEVEEAGDDGVYVRNAGSPSSTEVSDKKNGFEIAGAEGNGLFVGRADASGVVVNSAEVNGVRVEDAGWGGVSVGYAGTYGLHVHGSGSDAMYVHTAGQDGIHVSSATRYAGWFGGNVKVTGSCSGCLLVEYGVNSGETSLEAGDIVTIQGTVDSKFDGQLMLLQVSAAQVEQTVIGVVQGRANVEQYEHEGLEGSGETVERLVPDEGAAKPGEYVTIATFGPLQVKASQLGGEITAGTRLAVDENGLARALQTTEINGIQVAESAPAIGIALDEPETDGLVWVLVNPQ